MAALLHDLVDTSLHPSKLGCALTAPDPYVQWLCTHHHTFKAYPHNPALQLLHTADVRTSRYARALRLPTPRRQLIPINTRLLAQQLEQTARYSIHQLYQLIYHSKELKLLLASKRHPTETLRNHLIGVANWTLFLLRTHPRHPLSASVDRTGHPGATPGPVEMEDPRDRDEPSASW